MGLGCGSEAFDDVSDGGVGVCAAGDDEAGVVVEDGEDHDAFVDGDGPVAVVHLPGFVGLVGLESYPRAAWTLLGLGCDVSVVGEHPVDG